MQAAMAVRRHIVASALALLIIAAQTHDTANALIGADIADISLQQYTVAVASMKGRCTGVVLAQDIVLTAAHCARDAPNLWVGGNPGLGDPANPPVGLSPVAEVVVHPRHGSGVDSSDLALLKLAKPLPDRFVPAYLAPHLPGIGDDLVATGYGKSAQDDPKTGTVLRMDVLRVRETPRDFLILVSARAEPSGGGPGDSGGPVFTVRGSPALVAIIVGGSFSQQTTAVPIAPNYMWIKDTIEKLSGR
jgi:hypothetical protein